jgi:hypothetical protein
MITGAANTSLLVYVRVKEIGLPFPEAFLQ